MERMKRCMMAIAKVIAMACLVALAGCTFDDLPMRKGIEDLGLKWTQVAEFAGDTTTPGDQYGLSVSISGDWAAVGCPGETISTKSGAGAVYLYHKENGAWQRMQKLGGLTTNGYFGRSVALSGNHLLVGAAGENLTKGAAHIYTLSGGTWGTPIALTAPGGVAGDYFGMAVALSDSWAFIGAPYFTGALLREGAVYAFSELISAPGPWGSPDNAVTLHGQTNAQNEFFGSSLSVSGDYLIVGSPYDYMPPSLGGLGAVNVFFFDGSVWGSSSKPTTTLTMPGTRAFGASVSIFDDTMVVGSPGNESAYVYARSGTAWNPTRVFDPDSQSGYLFGSAVSISSQGAIIGAMFDSRLASQAGKGYAFSAYGSGWLLDQRFVASAPAADAVFGQTVSVSDNAAIIGAYGYDSIPGHVYILEKTR
jgi:hypothetical protein